MRIRGRGSCSAVRWKSRNWSAGIPTGCTLTSTLRQAPAKERSGLRQRGTPPDDLTFGGAREHARHDEQQVGETIQIFERFGRDAFDTRQRPTAAFSAPTDRSRQVTGRRRRTSAGKDEFLERR